MNELQERLIKNIRVIRYFATSALKKSVMDDEYETTSTRIL